LGFAIDYDATLEAAYAHGRDGSVVERYGGVLVSTIHESFPIVFTQDEAVLTSFLERIGPEINGAARDARLYLSEGQVKVLANRDGRQLDIEQAVHDTISAIQTASHASVTLHTVPVVSQITAADLEPLQQQAEILVS